MMDDMMDDMICGDDSLVQVGSTAYSELILDGESHRIKIGSPTRYYAASLDPPDIL